MEGKGTHTHTHTHTHTYIYIYIYMYTHTQSSRVRRAFLTPVTLSKIQKDSGWTKVMYAEFNFSIKDFIYRVTWSVLIRHCATKADVVNI